MALHINMKTGRVSTFSYFSSKNLLLKLYFQKQLLEMYYKKRFLELYFKERLLETYFQVTAPKKKLHDLCPRANYTD
jgi:hypothetical protein